MIPLAHSSPQHKRHLDQFSHFCIAHGRVSSGMPEHVLSIKIAPSHGDLDPHLIVVLGPTCVCNPNGISIGSAIFAQHVRMSLFMLGHALPPQNCPFSWGIWTPSSTWFLGSTWLSIPNGILIGSAVFAQLTAECPYTLQWATLSPSYFLFPSNTWFLGPTPVLIPYDISISFCRAHYCDRLSDRQTDKPHYSVCNNRPQLPTLRPNNTCITWVTQRAVKNEGSVREFHSAWRVVAWTLLPRGVRLYMKWSPVRDSFGLRHRHPAEQNFAHRSSIIVCLRVACDRVACLCPAYVADVSEKWIIIVRGSTTVSAKIIRSSSFCLRSVDRVFLVAHFYDACFFKLMWWFFESRKRKQMY